MYRDPESTDFEFDEPENVICELCQDDKDILDCDIVIGYWVCSECQSHHLEENESVIESLIKLKRRKEEKAARMKRETALMDWSSLIHTIEKDLKPFVKATT